MKKLFGFLVLLFPPFLTLYSQAPSWNWVNSVNNNQEELANDVAVDPSTGNVYIVGNWEGNLSATFLPTGIPSTDFSSTYGNQDGFVAKYDSDGNRIWSFKVGCNQTDDVTAVTVDPSGNVYITGYFQDNTAEFTGTGTLTGSTSLINTDNDSDFFIAKYNPDGELLWVRQGYSSGNRNIAGLDVTAYNNGVFAVGYYNDDVVFGAITLTDDGSFNQYFLINYDVNGNEQWATHGATNNHDYNTKSYFNGVATDGTNVFVTGNFKGPNFDLYDKTNALVATVPNTQDNRAEIVLISFSVSGIFNWIQTIGGDRDEEDRALVLDNDSIYLVGGIGDDANFPGYAGNPVNSSGNMDIFISSHAKSDGNTGWVKVASCTDGGDELAESVTIDTYNNIIITGYFEGTLNVDGNLITSSGQDEVMVASITNNGTFNWMKSAGSNGNDQGLGISSNGTDKIYVTGRYRDLASFDTFSLPDNGNNNIFLGQIDPCVSAIGGDATTTDSVLCIGDNTTIFLSGSLGSVQWQSSPAGLNTWSDIAGATTSSYVVSPVASTDYRAILIQASCSTDTSDVLPVTVHPIPTGTISGDASVCEGTPTPLDFVFTGTAPYDFTYTDGSSNFNVSAHPTNNYNTNVTPPTTRTYTLTTITDDNGCSAAGAGSATITVQPVVAISTHPVSQQVCPGTNVSMNVVASGSDLTYQWQKNAVNMAGETAPVLTLNAVGAADAAAYTCIVSSSCGGPLTSNAANLTLYNPTVITAHPADVYHCFNENLNLSVSATGSNITYQWRKDGVDIPGETLSVFSISGVTTGDNGAYTCMVSGTCGIIESNPANVTVDAQIVITTQPVSKSACPGANVSFSVTAMGTSLSYQWQKNGVDIGGETSQSLILNNVVAGDAGNYRCVISSPCGATLNSNIAVLTINSSTQIIADPVDQLECEGGNVSFEVTATGSGLAYQWMKDGMPLADGGTISGALTNQLLITGVVAGDMGQYTCQVTGSCGMLNSNPATLTVDDAITITTQPVNQSSCPGNNISFVVVASGSNLSYQWQKNTVDIPGETQATLNLNSLGAGDAGNYRCVITNSCGANLISNVAFLTIGTATSITLHPSDAVECVGNNINFSVTATGSGLSYQWYKDGVPLVNGGDISGALSNSLIVANLDVADAGSYYCGVAGSCGLENSNPAVLTVDDNITITTQPQDVQACNADNISFNIMATGSNLSYQWQKNGVDMAGENSAVLSLTSINAGDVAAYRCVLSNSCGSIVNSQTADLSLYINTSITLQPIGVTRCIGGNASFTVTTAGSNLTYQWRKDGVNLVNGGNISGSSTNVVSINGILAGDAGVYTCEVTGSCGIINSDPATLDLKQNTAVTTHPLSQAVCPNANAVFNVSANGTNTSYQWQKDGVDLVGETNSGLIITGVAAGDAGVYRCIVTGDCGSSTSNGALLTVNQDVTISVQPVDDEICENGSAGFMVTAAGTGLSYQWRHNGIDLVDGGNITGATTSNLTINTVNTADAGVYSCVITGTCGNETSNPASLVVDEEIVITTQPQNKTACTNDNIIFNVIATGTNLTYQWQKDGVDIGGETNSALLLTNVTAVDVAVYRCVLSADCGTTFTNGASLTVNQDVVITTQPMNKEVCEGDNVGFTVSATGTGLNYQWKLNGTNLVDGANITGATSNNLSINMAGIADAGTYTCEVTGSCSAVNSNPATLVVDEVIFITTHPQNKTGCPGNNITFSVVASGTNLTYQWQKDGVDILGETNAGLLLSNIAAGDAAVYRCVVSGDCGTSYSNGATLAVNTDVAITLQPVDDEVCEGASSGFVLTATGTGLTYQWKLNGANLIDGVAISGSNTNSLSISTVSTADAGVYTCEVIGTCGTVNSTPVNLVVDENITISAHPINVTACPAQNANFSVTASGSNLTYQWQKDGVNMPGETNPGLVLLSVTDADEGIYRCVITGDCGVLISNGASLVVDEAVAITTQPAASQNLCEGDNLNLNIVATGTGLLYQWQKNGIDLADGGNLSGANSDNLIISGVSVSDDGIYTCIVTGSCGTENSILSDITIYPATVVTQHPVTYVVVEGGNASFSVVADGNSLTYQWQKDGVNLVDGGIISGATMSILDLTGVAEADEGAYRCVVTGTCNVSNSNPANLMVNPTSNITTQPISISRCEGESAGFSVVASGGGLTYQWRLDGIDLADNANISGSNTSNITINSVSLSDAGAYTCIVNAESSAPAILTVNRITTIVTHPVAAVRCEGDNAIFTVSATGDGMTYQWQKDGVNLVDGGTLNGSTTPVLTISSTVLANAGNYRCVVMGICVTANTNPASLVVNQNTLITAQPLGNTICEGASHVFSVTSDGSNLTYQWKKDGVNLIDGGNISGATSANLTISNALLADAGAYTCSVAGACGNENSVIAQLFVEQTTAITLHPIASMGCNGDNISFSILADGTALTYQWQKDGVNLVDGGTVSGAGTPNLTISGIVPADAGSYVCAVSGNCGTENSDPAVLTSYANTQITTQPLSSTICENATLTLTVVASGDNLTYQWQKDGVNLSDVGNITGSGTANLNIAIATLSNNGTYTCVVSGSCGTENSNLAIVTVRPNTNLTVHPLDAVGCEGDNMNFSVIADGHNLTYQWQKDGVNLADGGIISGATAPLLTLTGISPVDGGSYRCVVTGSCGVDNSNPAVLTSYQNTAITLQPSGGTICTGGSITMSVTANGDNLTYQWKKGGTNLSDGGNISGSNMANLTITSATVANSGTYTCEVSGSCGTENSALAIVNVEQQTQITLQPSDIGACEGDNISFSVLAEGVNLTYQWQKDGANLSDGGSISGSGSTLLQITGILPADAGSYRCVITGNCGIQNSNPAILSAFNNTSITTQPVDKTVCEGDQVTLNVTALGDNLLYQWKKNGVALVDGGNISGSATSNLLINNSVLSDAGVYTCDVAGSCGTENSAPATVTIRSNTAISLQPANMTRCEGDVAVFKVNATGESLTYLWQKDGAPLSDGGNIFGSATSILTLNNLTTADAGTYRCIITGTCGVLNSDASDLTVNAYPVAAGVIIGPASVCQGDNNVIYEVAAIVNADDYIWNLPVGVTILSGDSTRLIEVAFIDNELGGNITVQGANTCGLGSVSPALTVTANPVPNALAGADQHLCTDNTTLAAIDPGAATGVWSVMDGPATVTNVNLYNSSITNLRQGTNTLIWTVSQNGCSSSDTVIIKNNSVSIEAGTDVTICTQSIVLEGNSVPTGATGSWSVNSGTASFVNGNDPNTIASGFASGLNELKWTITNGSCVFYDTVTIDNQMPAISYAGIDQSICLDTTVLGANIPAIGVGNWTVIAGSATFANPSQGNTVVRNLGQGDNILRWTITNGICSSIDEVTISNNQVTVNAGIDQVLCDRTTDLAGDPPVTGMGNWSVIQGAAVFVNNNQNDTRVTGLAYGDNVLVWNINNNGCISTDTVMITNDSPTDADAGNDQIITADFTTLQGNIPAIGTGSWSLISGSANIADPLLYNTNVTSLGLGANTFRWTVIYNSCISTDDVIITNFMPTTTDAGPDQTICSDETTLDANEPVFGFGEWSVIQGAATFTDNSRYNTTVTGLAKGDNVLRWTVWENGYTSDDVVITNDLPTTANAGSDQTLCADSAQLFANEPIVGSGEWAVISGSGQFENDTLYNTKITNLAKGQNILKWTITNKSCSSSDLVTISNDLPTIAYAGVDQVICSNMTTLNPNTPTVGIGEWSITSGAGSFNENVVSKLASGSNTLRWTITNNACSSYDELTVTNNKPNTPNAGASKSICYDSITLAATPPVIGTGLWTLQNGSATIVDINSPTSKVTNISQGLNVFRWTVTYNGCSEYDEIVVNNALIVATTGTDQEICDETTILEANNSGEGIGTWSVLGGSGAAVFDNPSQPDTRVSGLDQGANVLRWTITNEICSSYSDVVINNNLPTTSFAGPDESICSDNTTLQANTPLVGTGQWSILSGSATISNPTSPTSPITNLNYGVNTLRWTIANKGCSSSDEVVIFNNATIASNAGNDQVICADSTVLYGNNPPFGTGQWSVVSGSATFMDNNDYNSKVVNLGPSQNILRWVISNGGCSSTDEVMITNNAPSRAIAGADKTICGNTTTLTANIPSIGTGQWSLVSGAAIFANNNLYNTSVTGLNPGQNTLRWTIENQGCISYDNIVVTNDLPYVADAGPDMTVCGTVAELYANDPVLGIGEWNVISGTATFDDPSRFDANVSELGFGVNTLRWTITYDKCVTYDELTITNHQIDVYAGVDQVTGESSTLLAASNPSMGTGQWSVIGGSGVFSQQNSSITQVSGLGAGLNTFRWAVDINGCISDDDVSVTYNVPPDASFVISKDAGCPPLEVYFVNNSLDNLSFTWDFGDGTTSGEVTVKHTYTAPGTYRPTITIIGNAGEVVTKDTVIRVYNQPRASFLVVNREVYIPEEEALFISTSSDASTYLWEFGDGETSSDRDPRHIYETEGVYDIILHVWSEYQCYDSVRIAGAVEVSESGTIRFPNGFTPNTDGPSGGAYDPNDFSNDVFYPIGEGMEEYHLEVYNKWGILIFESNDVNIGWDGYYKGKLLDEGVYVWRVTGTYNNGKELKETGTVLLLR